MTRNYIRLFCFFVIFSNVITYIVGNNLLNYITIFSAVALIFISSLNNRIHIKIDELIPLGLLSIFCMLSLLYYLSEPYRDRILSAHLMTILLIPVCFFIFSISSQKDMRIDVSYIYKVFMYYLLVEVILCMEQIVYYNTGISMTSHLVGKKYDNMISGSHVNANNLATVIVLISYIFSQIEFKIKKISATMFWLLIFLLVILTSSRSSLVMVLVIFFFTRKISLFSKLTYMLLFSVAILVFFSLGSEVGTDSLVLKRIIERIYSIYSMAIDGISSNNSMDIRYHSYIYFFNNLPNLGIGSGIIGDYFKYSGDANFDKSLMFTNPHSYIVEIGYWLGIPGLLLITFILLLLMIKYNGSLLLLTIIILTSSIPSSIFDFYQYFFLFFMCYFVKKITN